MVVLVRVKQGNGTEKGVDISAPRQGGLAAAATAGDLAMERSAPPYTTDLRYRMESFSAVRRTELAALGGRHGKWSNAKSEVYRHGSRSTQGE